MDKGSFDIPPIELDGSILEGGGQILRIAASLSVLMKSPIIVRNIRAGRLKGGLRPQHLKGLEIVREMCNGELQGGTVDSMEISFKPGGIKAGDFTADTKTAGSVSLIIQVALPVALFSSDVTNLTILGGTNVILSPFIDYTINVFRPIVQKFGGSLEFDLVKRGFYPKGGGEVMVSIKPVKFLLPLTLTDFGEVERIWGIAYVAGIFPFSVAEKMVVDVNRAFAVINWRVEVQIVQESPSTAVGNGMGLAIFVRTTTGCYLGASRMAVRAGDAQDMATDTANELLELINDRCCVDRYMQDQVISLMALARGKSSVKCGPLTMHAQTAIHVAEKMTKAQFTIVNGQGFTVIECVGVGLENEKI